VAVDDHAEVAAHHDQVYAGVRSRAAAVGGQRRAVGLLDREGDPCGPGPRDADRLEPRQLVGRAGAIVGTFGREDEEEQPEVAATATQASRAKRNLAICRQDRDAGKAVSNRKRPLP
jgi:hypothetical protein